MGGSNSAASGIQDFFKSIGYLSAHPGQLPRLPRWLRELNARPLDLRTPWWPYAVIDYIEQRLPRRSRVLEFGGGGSSLWLVDHGAALTVVEHHPEWAKQLREALPESVELMHVPATSDGGVRSDIESGYFDDYVSVAERYPDDSFDLVIVDGRARVDCAKHALTKIKPGGMLLLDDSDRARYRPVHEELRSWPGISIRGLKTGNPLPATTSVWQRPGR